MERLLLWFCCCRLLRILAIRPKHGLGGFVAAVALLLLQLFLLLLLLLLLLQLLLLVELLDSLTAQLLGQFAAQGSTAAAGGGRQRRWRGVLWRFGLLFRRGLASIII
jgi:hypothetical protein